MSNCFDFAQKKHMLATTDLLGVNGETPNLWYYIYILRYTIENLREKKQELIYDMFLYKNLLKRSSINKYVSLSHMLDS